MAKVRNDGKPKKQILDQTAAFVEKKTNVLPKKVKGNF
jgi:hypothetical protein